MRFRVLAVVICGGICLATSAQTITTFDVPGAVQTIPTSINNSGTITGSHTDSGGVGHGFLRTASGEFTTFDAPGAFTVFQVPGGTTTAPQSINAGGAIAGYYWTGAIDVGFLRSPGGAFTTFQVSPYGTGPLSINSSGEVTGSYSVDASGDSVQGFVRDAAGMDRSTPNQSASTTTDRLRVTILTRAAFSTASF
jgi:hypothetical protein